MEDLPAVAIVGEGTDDDMVDPEIIENSAVVRLLDVSRSSENLSTEEPIVSADVVAIVDGVDKDTGLRVVLVDTGGEASNAPQNQSVAVLEPP